MSKVIFNVRALDAECEDEIGRVIDVVSPDCKVYTQFPFDDLTESPKDITCTATLTLKNSSINDTGITPFEEGVTRLLSYRIQ